MKIINLVNVNGVFVDESQAHLHQELDELRDEVICFNKMLLDENHKYVPDGLVESMIHSNENRINKLSKIINQ